MNVPVKLSHETGSPGWHPSAYVYVPGRYVLHELRDVIRHLAPGTVVTVLCDDGPGSRSPQLYDGWYYTVPEDACM